MPVWHEETKEARESGELVVLGVIQEQHADRCRLFAQWKGFDWPIVQDPINLLGARAVPMFVAIDEAGVVVDSSLRTDKLADFLERPNEKGQEVASSQADSRLKLFEEDLRRLQSERRGRTLPAGTDWLTSGDLHLLWGANASESVAIERYGSALESDPESAALWFRLGVAHRARFDSEEAVPDDFAKAASAWDRALELDPNHYIYRRRIQQYGPRLTKPYPFYDWIEQARAEILARGETPEELGVEPVGAEIASPSKKVGQSQDANASLPSSPDPDGRITRDEGEFVRVDVVVVPGRIKPGQAVRVHLKLTPTATTHWNNEAEATKVWVDVPDGWEMETPLLELSMPEASESVESRTIDFELRSSDSAKETVVQAFSLDYICEELGGQCLYRRQDIPIPVRFDP